MRFMEIANPEDQLALWRLISDNVWSAVMAQAKQAAAQKAQAAANPKPKKFKPKKAIPKPPPAPKPKSPTPIQKPVTPIEPMTNGYDERDKDELVMHSRAQHPFKTISQIKSTLSGQKRGF